MTTTFTDRQAFMTTLTDVIRRDQTRRERRKKVGKAASATWWFLVRAVLLWAFHAWLFMLAVAVIHDHWLPDVPTLGFWWAGLIVWLLRGALIPIVPSRRPSRRPADAAR